MSLKLYVWKLRRPVASGTNWVWDLGAPGAQSIRGAFGVVDYGFAHSQPEALAVGLAALDEASHAQEAR